MIYVENYNRRLVILNEDGILDKEIHCLLRHPFDVTCLDDTTVTVSPTNGIEIIHIDSTKSNDELRLVNHVVE